MSALGTLHWVDLAMLAVLALSVIVGVVRGFVFEVLALVGWVVAYFAAQWFGRAVAPYVPIGNPGSAVNLGVALVVTFVGALILWGLAARVVRLLVAATPLSLPNRVLGAGFGALRGVVLLLAVATAVALTPAGRSPAWQRSQGAGWLAAMLQELKPMLPDAVGQHLPTQRL